MQLNPIFPLGDNSDAPLLSTVCGREVPGPIRSTGNSMFIQFTSDASVVSAGFNASIHKSTLLPKINFYILCRVLK